MAVELVFETPKLCPLKKLRTDRSSKVNSHVLNA